MTISLVQETEDLKIAIYNKLVSLIRKKRIRYSVECGIITEIVIENSSDVMRSFDDTKYIIKFMDEFETMCVFKHECGVKVLEFMITYNGVETDKSLFVRNVLVPVGYHQH
ncbi:MAG: hypothetical protein IT280_04890 [Ignavibacteria bacterium]|nr:hypothetical protein [Ignavibacteria bacterium]